MSLPTGQYSCPPSIGPYLAAIMVVGTMASNRRCTASIQTQFGRTTESAHETGSKTEGRKGEKRRRKERRRRRDARALALDLRTRAPKVRIPTPGIAHVAPCEVYGCFKQSTKKQSRIRLHRIHSFEMVESDSFQLLIELLMSRSRHQLSPVNLTASKRTAAGSHTEHR